ncbi:FMN-dependent oxidoreductase (nitrilotriacetate monooxygenase family) [Okibacterium sp. HSC-33S16]|uniref:LLM class flavin-dependent oxidoreductase n=1 Tax=Okibacterium sp. HSC-33S16 TaxID=2910965 RepID=UPI00209D464B|nr:LLM class flavin-dependent oxidoreductase [Okibacterium sp. HSC-33S16]MCP2032193.1 FMN-dependent oxidoreductase (nitrilotriacetate monooxygenase family) [Okibacterium sp. HSC-33S16]
MPEKKKLILNLFEMNCVSHITHGLWTLDGNHRDRFNDIEYWTELAQLVESGGFDSIFLADVVGAYDVFRDGIETPLVEGLQIPNNDPLLVIPAMAAVTKHVGFGVTFSTTYEPPFAFARRMSTLDHLTKGRVGWNIVTSYLPNAARNFGLDGEIPHDRRYEIADEYLDVLYKLWEGSWDDDAVVADRARRVYTDPSKVRLINHVGENFRVAGPHLSQPSRQRTPVLFQATGSPAGVAFAGKHAEVLFTGGRTVADFQRNVASVRDAAEANGRSRNDVRFIVQAAVIVGRTDAEAHAKQDLYRQNTSIDGILAHSSLPFDPTAYPPETTIRQILEAEGLLDEPFVKFLSLDTTAGDFLAERRESWNDRFSVVGTPAVVADEIEKWLDEDGIDGINLRQYHSYDTARDFIELVVPELRKRGRLREEYTPGETLRERLFGAGPRLPEQHFATRYRGGANLDAELEPVPVA